MLMPDLPDAGPHQNISRAIAQAVAAMMVFLCGAWVGAGIARQAMWEQAGDRNYAYQERYSGQWRWVDPDPWPEAGMSGKTQPAEQGH